jgi:hypothetical protein
MAATDKLVRARELRAKLHSQLEAVCETVNAAMKEGIVLTLSLQQDPGAAVRIQFVKASVEVD